MSAHNTCVIVFTTDSLGSTQLSLKKSSPLLPPLLPYKGGRTFHDVRQRLCSCLEIVVAIHARVPVANCQSDGAQTAEASRRHVNLACLLDCLDETKMPTLWIAKGRDGACRWVSTEQDDGRTPMLVLPALLFRRKGIVGTRTARRRGCWQ